MRQKRNNTVLANEGIEVGMVNITFVRRSEVEAQMEVTYTAGGMVFHQSNCWAQQRIIDLEKSPRLDAVVVERQIFGRQPVHVSPLGVGDRGGCDYQRNRASELRPAGARKHNNSRGKTH